VLHHSLNEHGHIASYDVKWPDGTIDLGVPSVMLEEINKEVHEHEATVEEGDE
tara:strand:+ start:396 stop:554 length:159 start_codon:yes stop_codon:yes gene_type:complete